MVSVATIKKCIKKFRFYGINIIINIVWYSSLLLRPAFLRTFSGTIMFLFHSVFVLLSVSLYLGGVSIAVLSDYIYPQRGMLGLLWLSLILTATLVSVYFTP
jgi:hypothetical protein